jgi:hypothetical protein
MKYIYENGCSWSKYTFLATVYYQINGGINGGINGLDNIKYLYKNGCPWNTSRMHHFIKIGKQDIGQNNRINTIKWLRENGNNWNTYNINGIEY